MDEDAEFSDAFFILMLSLPISNFSFVEVQQFGS
jgi:hypothetical protein